MLYLVVSDIHGSSMGTDLLRAAIALHHPDVVIVLGDILYGARDTDEGKLISFFNRLEVPVMAVRGNCDYSSDSEVLGFALPLERSFHLSGHRFFLQHYPQFINSMEPGDVCLFGHTHTKLLHDNGGTIVGNPGSIGKPRDGSPGYMLIDEKGISLYEANSFGEISRISF